MKKLFLFVGFLFWVGVVSAQNTSIGLRLGLNLSKYNDESAQNLVGANFGAFLNRSIHANWGLSAELNFTMRGAKSELLGTSLTNRVNYLEVPVYINYFFLDPESKIRPKLFLGGYGSYLMTATINDQDIKANLNNLDFGVLFGGGLHYSLGGGTWLIFDVRYGLGLADISKTDLTDVKNRNLSFNLGYSFPLGDTK